MLEHTNVNMLFFGVLAYMGGRGATFSAAAIVRGSGLSQAKVYRELKKMVDTGLVLKVGRGIYALNAAAGFWQDVYGHDAAWHYLWSLHPDGVCLYGDGAESAHYGTGVRPDKSRKYCGVLASDYLSFEGV